MSPSVYLFVRLNNARIVTKRKKIVPIFLYHIKYHSSYRLLTRRMIGGGDPFYLKFWIKLTRWKRKRIWIFAHSASAVIPAKKVQLNTNRKSTTRFPMSPRWTPYVAPKPPKGGLKRNTAIFRVKLHFTLYRPKESLLRSFFVWILSATKL